MLKEEEYILEGIGKRIKSLRKEKNITQFDIASLSDIDVRLIQRLEAGKTDVRITTIYKVAKGFNMSFVEFFTYEKG